MRSFKLSGKHHHVVLSQGNYTLGRSPNCDITVDDPNVSRFHASIQVDGEEVTVEDLRSLNGVFVEGERIYERTRLTAGTRFSVGDSVLQLLEVDDFSRPKAKWQLPTEPQAQAPVLPARSQREAFQTAPAPIIQLSARERQVLALIALGHTHREVAEQLSISVKTVEGYRARLASKLNLKTRAELVRYALDAGFLGTDL